MAAPTRPQIEAIVTQPTYTIEYWNGSVWIAFGDQYVVDMSGAFQSDDGGAQPLGFGASVGVSGTLVLTADAPAWNWQRTPVRGRFGFAGSDEVPGLWGVAGSRSDTPESQTYDLGGIDAYVRGLTLHSRMIVGRTAATATSVSSVEDPSAGNYQGGIINWILWSAGGRPLEQAGSYPNATFYYTCQNAVMGPTYAWIAGDDPWQELARLCVSCGGQIYQRPDGVVAYVNPLTLGGTAGYTLDVGTCTSETRTDDQLLQVAVKYTTRARQPFGIVYQEQTPRLITAGATVQFTVSPDTPVIEWYTTNGSTVHPEHIRIVDFIGQPATSGITVTMPVQDAARATIQIVNSRSDHIVVTRLDLYGLALAVVGEGEVTIGSGTPQTTIDPVNVQDATHATRIGTMIRDFYQAPRARRSVSTIGYDPDRAAGEVITFVCDQPPVNGAHRINAIKPSNTGASMDVDLVDVSGVPVLNDFFLVDGSYSAGTTKKVGY